MFFEIISLSALLKKKCHTPSWHVDLGKREKLLIWFHFSFSRWVWVGTKNETQMTPLTKKIMRQTRVWFHQPLDAKQSFFTPVVILLQCPVSPTNLCPTLPINTEVKFYTPWSSKSIDTKTALKMMKNNQQLLLLLTSKWTQK